MRNDCTVLLIAGFIWGWLIAVVQFDHGAPSWLVTWCTWVLIIFYAALLWYLVKRLCRAAFRRGHVRGR